MINKAEVDMTVNGEVVWENHKPENGITQGRPDSYEELPLDRYIHDGGNEIIIKVSDASQCFIYFRGIEIR